MDNAGISRLSQAVFIVGLVAGAAVFVAGPGTRLELWQFGTGFTVMRWGAWTGGGVAAVALIACFLVTSGTPQRGLGLAAAGLVSGVLAFSFPLAMLNMARRAAPISDITTDMQDPPRFVRIVKLRDEAGARNPATYGGPKVAAVQRRVYPDIAPLMVALPFRAVFDNALAVGVDLGWDIVSVAPAAGRIEATATTGWFGFQDDVVVRVARKGTETRVDIRSTSRVGRNDLGTNAARIRTFLRTLATRLGRIRK